MTDTATTAPHLARLLERHRAITVDADRLPAIPFIPNTQTYLITCIDPRVDPAPLLGLELGDAIVARTVGGRVTPAVLQDLAWITHLHRTKTPDAEWFELAVIHHTDCGSALLADDDLRHDFARTFGYDDATLAGLAVTDPAVTVAADVATLRSSPAVDDCVIVSGYTLDTATGRISPATGT